MSELIQTNDELLLVDDQSPIISIHNLSKKYGNKLALNEVNLNLRPGRIIGLLGPNGSGKTTLMKILTGLIHDYKGEVTINGSNIGAYTKSIVSFLSDEPYFPK